MRALTLTIISLIIFSALISAIMTCDAFPSSVSYESGTTTQQSVSISCTNNGNQSITVTKGGTAGSYFTFSEGSSVIFGSNSSKNLILNFDENAPSNIYSGLIDFSDDTSAILFNLDVTSAYNGQILLFPTSKILTVQQGYEKTQNIMLTVPSNYPRVITIQSVDFNPGTETIMFGDLNLGQVAPGQSISIPIIFSGINAQVGTYQTNLNIFAIDSEGMIDLPSVSLQLQITQGINPVTNQTFTTPPSCTLSSIIMNLNETNTLTCSNVQNNIQVTPQFNEFFQGQPPVELSGGVYRYIFKAVKFGNTNFISTFSYMNSPIHAPYIQEVKISSSGSLIPGTTLQFKFTPSLSLLQPGEQVIIQLVDNKTGSLVENPEIQINAVILTNSTGKSFMYNFESDLNYEIRGISPGYENLIQTINITEKPIYFNITPESGDSETTFSITTTPANSTIYINGIKIETPNNIKMANGDNLIQIYKEGFTTTEYNFTVGKSLTLTPTGEFKKGVLQTFLINDNVTWSVIYQKNLESNLETLKTGFSDKIEFEPTSTGSYIINFGDKSETKIIEGVNWDFYGMKWYWWILIIIIIIIIIFAISKNKKTTDNIQFAT